MQRKRGAAYTLLTLLIGAMLLMIDILPLLLWFQIYGFSGTTPVTEEQRATVIGSFIVALLLCPLWAFAVHRGVRFLLHARTQKTPSLPADATESVKPKEQERWATGKATPRQAG
jgi:hypothetical protein